MGPTHSVASSTPLQGGEDLTAGKQDNGAAGAGDHLSAEAGNPHFQTVEIPDGVHLLSEPAAHLNPGVALGPWNHVERGIDLLPQLQPPSAVKPGVVALGVQAEGHRGEPLAGRRLAGPVVGGAAAAFHGAVGDRVKGAQRRDELSAGEHLDVEPAVDGKGIGDKLQRRGHDQVAAGNQEQQHADEVQAWAFGSIRW